jgi:hypothetical protein
MICSVCRGHVRQVGAKVSNRAQLDAENRPVVLYRRLRSRFLKLAVPAVGRVGVIVYPDDAIDALTIPRLSAATRALGITLEQFEVRDLTKLEAVAAVIGRRSSSVQSQLRDLRFM